MKVLTETELILLQGLDELYEAFTKELPYHIPREKEEFKKRIDDCKHIIAIRAMLRDGDGLGMPEQNKLPPAQKMLQS